MKFHKLHLENFQAHKDTTVTFTDGLNTIIGESDVGKSSILRALRKLVRDIPAGKDFINKDASVMKISLTIIDDEGQQSVIVRQVTPSKNLYYLDDQEFGGFGREIPEEVQQALEMFIVELENSEKIDLHFFDQHDTPFMVAKGSAGTRSKLLGRISGLHVLDRGIIAVNKDIRAGRHELTAKDAQRDDLQGKVDCAEDTSNDHKLCDECAAELKVVEKDLIALEALKVVYAQLTSTVKKGQDLRKILDSLPEIEADFPEIRASIQRAEKLKALSEGLTKVDQKIVSIPIIDIDTDIDYSPLRENIQRLDKLKALQGALDSTTTQISTLEMVDVDPDIANAQKLWTDTLVAMQICPLCKQSTHHMGE